MIKKKIHIDMIKLHEDMLQKREQIPEDIDDFLKIIQSEIRWCNDLYVCDFRSVKNYCFDGEIPSEIQDFVELIQKIQDFISFYYNIYDDIIYLEL